MHNGMDMALNSAETATDINSASMYLKPFSPIAIGSLPFKDLNIAMNIVKTHFPEIPFWPQLTKLSTKEDMILQFSENMPLFIADEKTNYMQKTDKQNSEKLEEFFCDYEKIAADINGDAIEKYAISTNHSAAFPEFLNIIKTTHTKFAKGQIAGPFTFSATVVDTEGKCTFYNSLLREIITKTLTLKALWQIKHIKRANAATTPIIFIDEPSLSQLKNYDTDFQDTVISMLNEISYYIRRNGAVSAVHCCSKCNWSIPLKAGVDIINPDTYTYTRDLSFYKEIEHFLKNGGKIAWGIVPTLDKNAIAVTDINELINIFNNALKYLTETGINEKLIIKNSLITPSCGTGGLDDEMAFKAMRFTVELSKKLKEKYSIDN